MLDNKEIEVIEKIIEDNNFFQKTLEEFEAYLEIENDSDTIYLTVRENNQEDDSDNIIFTLEGDLEKVNVILYISESWTGISTNILQEVIDFEKTLKEKFKPEREITWE